MLLLMAFLCPLSMHAQSSQTLISGQVTDADSGKPVASVSVYLSGTLNGSQTDSSGRYSFKTSLTGEFQLVASLVGFGRKVRTIVLNGADSLKIDFGIQQKEIDLGEIRVTASNYEWERDFNLLMDFLKGEEQYARKLEIENKEVLNFERDKDGKWIHVSSEVPVILRNEELGYRVEMEIQEITFNPKHNNGTYKVLTSFSVLSDLAPDMFSSWRDNRRSVYRGSSLHFFRSLIQGTYKKEGFEVVRWGGEFREIKEPRQLSYYLPGNWDQIMEQYRIYQLADPPVIVGYRMKFNMLDEVQNPENLTRIEYATNRPLFILKQDGSLLDPAYLNYSGKWAQERESLLLPANYTPD